MGFVRISNEIYNFISPVDVYLCKKYSAKQTEAVIFPYTMRRTECLIVFQEPQYQV